jgi:heme/copper-type cytochrome/quinol oxidase subunit 4
MHANLSNLPVWAIVVGAVLAVIQVALDVIALVDLYRRPVARVQFGNKWIWVVVIVLVNTIGAILYLVIGRLPAVPDPALHTPARASVRAEDIVNSLYDDGPQ